MFDLPSIEQIDGFTSGSSVGLNVSVEGFVSVFSFLTLCLYVCVSIILKKPNKKEANKHL